MTAEQFGQLGDAAIPALCGLWMFLLGLRVVGKRPGASLEYDQWHARHHGMLTTGGVVLVLIAVVRVAMSSTPTAPVAARPPATPASPADAWRRCTTAGAWSAEFPRPPRPHQQSNGVVTSEGLRGDAQGVDYWLTWSDLPQGMTPLPDDAWIDATRDELLQQVIGDERFTLAREARLDGGGRELELATSSIVIVGRWYTRGTRMYRAMAVGPLGRRDDAEVRRFLDSVRLAPP